MKIDNNIPLPRNRSSKYVKIYEDIKVGDSVFFSNETCTNKIHKGKKWGLRCRDAESFSECLRKKIKNLKNLTTTIRKVEGGYRVWLIEKDALQEKLNMEKQNDKNF